MDRFNVVMNKVHVCLVSLADCLYGCSHRTSFPITLAASVTKYEPQSRSTETYIVCLECGRHFAYDWATMRVIKPPAAWVRKRPELSEVPVKHNHDDRLVPQAVA